MCDLPNAERTVYEKVFPLTISHCADRRRPSPAKKQRFPMNKDWLETPRKPISESERVINVVAKQPNPKGLLKTQSVHPVHIYDRIEGGYALDWRNDC